MSATTMPAITLPARCDRAAAEALLPEFQSAQGAGVLRIDASQTSQIARPCCNCWSQHGAAATTRRSRPAVRCSKRPG